MSKENNIQDLLHDVADAIREKKGTEELINPQDFGEEIRGIESGGGNLNADLDIYSSTTYGPSNLLSAIVHEGVQELSLRAFFTANKLKSVSLPNSLLIIGESAFSGCKKLSEISGHEGVTSIGASAFSECYVIKNLSFPNVKSVGTYAFRYCYALARIYLGAHLESINGYAFGDISNPLVVIIQNITPPIIDAAVFSGTPNFTVYVPDESVEDYKIATNWSAYADKIKPMSEYVEPTTE